MFSAVYRQSSSSSFSFSFSIFQRRWQSARFPHRQKSRTRTTTFQEVQYRAKQIPFRAARMVSRNP